MFIGPIASPQIIIYGLAIGAMNILDLGHRIFSIKYLEYGERHNVVHNGGQIGNNL